MGQATSLGQQHQGHVPGPSTIVALWTGALVTLPPLSLSS